MLPEFRNEPLTDFSVPANRAAFSDALSRVEERLPLKGFILIGGRRSSGSKWFDSIDP